MTHVRGRGRFCSTVLVAGKVCADMPVGIGCVGAMFSYLSCPISKHVKAAPRHSTSSITGDRMKTVLVDLVQFRRGIFQTKGNHQ